MNELRFANPLKQIDILEIARRKRKMIHADPRLTSRASDPVKNNRQRYPAILNI
jgi:hypothetical protein